MAFPVTFESILYAVQSTVAAYRTAGGLPQLTGPDGVGTGTIAFGAEYLDFQLLSRRNQWLVFWPSVKPGDNNFVWLHEPPPEGGLSHILGHRNKYGLLAWFKTPEQFVEEMKEI